MQPTTEKTEKVNFDDYADDYDALIEQQLSFFNKENRYFAEYKIRAVEREATVAPKRVLEFGCGTGRNLQFLQEAYPNAEIHGCDISPKSLRIAEKENPDARLFLLEENSELPEEPFDLIFIACVFHHIAPPLRQGVMAQIHRLLNSGGELFIFEHNPYNPVTQKMVSACPFDADAVLLKPKELAGLMAESGLRVEKPRFALFFPSFLASLRPLEPRLKALPLGGQFYVKAVKP